MVLFLHPVNFHISWILLESQQKASVLFSVISTVMMIIPCGMNKANADAGCFLMIYTESHQYSSITSATHWKKIILLIAKNNPHFVFWLHLELAIRKFIIFRKILPFSGHDGETIFFPMKLPRNHYFWSQKPQSCKIYYYAKCEQKLVYWIKLLKKKS